MGNVKYLLISEQICSIIFNDLREIKTEIILDTHNICNLEVNLGSLEEKAELLLVKIVRIRYLSREVSSFK